MSDGSSRRGMLPLLAVVLCALVITFSASPVAADDGDVNDELEEAIDDYADAKEELAKTKGRKTEIKEEIRDGKKDVKRLRSEVNEFAQAAYMSGGLPPAVEILSAGDPDTAVDTIGLTSYLGEQSGKKLEELLKAKEGLAAEQESLEDEIDKAEKAEKKMRNARDKAARGVAAEGGGDAVTGPAASSAPEAEPAPRNADGSLPTESCTEDDPTTGGCITPRMKHALEQAVIVGYNKKTSCYRSLQDGGNHPEGKACDFTVGSSGNAASGDAKVYGDHVADWFVQNADALGVRIVIWYNMIWNPSRGGWHAFS
ncbi:MAG: coiled-coil domain-containing protein, partial [Stackebrandtia sp.]